MINKITYFSKDEIENFYKQISKNVRDLRESKGFSQLDLALRMDISSVAFYSNCENLRYGKHFNLEHIYKISKILEVEISEILKC